MHALELRIPPPIVALAIAATMWGISLVVPPVAPPAPLRTVIAIVIAFVGVGIDIVGAVSFFRAQTTVNPMKPTATSSLVTSGIYRYTRNPMYVGQAVVLLAWAIWIASIPALLGLPAFVLYLNRFQIAPEERALARAFGEAYAAYRARVRRWL
jgi:protein-S-isoprenylcysteine O-methyltransferase Ste14